MNGISSLEFDLELMTCIYHLGNIAFILHFAPPPRPDYSGPELRRCILTSLEIITLDLNRYVGLGGGVGDGGAGFVGSGGLGLKRRRGCETGRMASRWRQRKRQPFAEHLQL